jgi:dihydrofolate reductase
MSLKASVFIAVSLDGFIARKGGELDWLDAANAGVSAGEDCGYKVFFESVDVLIMGRKSYEKILSFNNWPYGKKPVIVLSSKSIIIPQHLLKTVSYSSESPTELCERLAHEGAKRLYIDGGITIQRFITAGLINDFTITVIPVIIGSGIPLFGYLKNDLPLKHLETKSYDFGFVQSSYEVLKQT